MLPYIPNYNGTSAFVYLGTEENMIFGKSEFKTAKYENLTIPFMNKPCFNFCDENKGTIAELTFIPKHFLVSNSLVSGSGFSIKTDDKIGVTIIVGATQTDPPALNRFAQKKLYQFEGRTNALNYENKENVLSGIWKLPDKIQESLGSSWRNKEIEDELIYAKNGRYKTLCLTPLNIFKYDLDGTIHNPLPISKTGQYTSLTRAGKYTVECLGPLLDGLYTSVELLGGTNAVFKELVFDAYDSRDQLKDKYQCLIVTDEDDSVWGMLNRIERFIRKGVKLGYIGHVLEEAAEYGEFSLNIAKKIRKDMRKNVVKCMSYSDLRQ